MYFKCGTSQLALAHEALTRNGWLLRLSRQGTPSSTITYQTDIREGEILPVGSSLTRQWRSGAKRGRSGRQVDGKNSDGSEYLPLCTTHASIEQCCRKRPQSGVATTW